MKIKNTHSFSVFVALSIFFKLFFCSFLTVASNPSATEYQCFQQVKEHLKMGTKRRRTILPTSQTGESLIYEEQLFAEKMEREDNYELLRKQTLDLRLLYLRLLNLRLFSYLRSHHASHLNSKKHLSLSILRI